MSNKFKSIAFNLLDKLPDASQSEAVDVLLRSADVRIERIVSNGQKSDPGFWYNQDHDEWVTILQGRASLVICKEQGVESEVHLQKGDCLDLPLGLKHRITHTSSKTVWLAVHYNLNSAPQKHK